jgi:peptidoglycan hydrolase-like protein with peptidoglycan-binding domain
MKGKRSGTSLRVILWLAVLSAFLTSGCPKTQETASPTTEGKTEPAEISKPEQVPPQAAAQLAEKPTPPAPKANQHLVSSGETLLDPAVPRDAKLFQGRLAGLGLYRGAIDGVWGRNSRAALRAFKEKNSLGDPESWDKETKIQVFRETGK